MLAGLDYSKLQIVKEGEGMRVIGLSVNIECEVDDLGGRLTEGDALWLAVMKVLGQLARGEVSIADTLSVGSCSPLVAGIGSIGALSLRVLAEASTTIL